MGKTLREIKRERQLVLLGGGINPRELPGSAGCRSVRETARLHPTPEDCCGKPMIPCWFRNKFKGFVCVTLQPMHWISVRKLGAMGYFKCRKQQDRTKLIKLLMED